MSTEGRCAAKRQTSETCKRLHARLGGQFETECGGKPYVVTNY